MYLYAVGTNITDLEKKGYYPEPLEDTVVVSMNGDDDNPSYRRAAEERG